MKITILLFVCLSFGQLVKAEENINECRRLFTLVDQGAYFNTKLGRLTENATYKTPILFGYRALYYFMNSKYEFWPTEKFANFKMGKKYIDLIIQLNPEEAELRLIRYSVQTNVPSFLDYKMNILEDKAKLEKASTDSKFASIHSLINGVLKQYP